MKAVMKNLDTALDCSKVIFFFLPPPASHFLSQKPQGALAHPVHELSFLGPVLFVKQCRQLNTRPHLYGAHLMRKLNAEEEKFGDNWTQEGCLLLESMSS